MMTPAKQASAAACVQRATPVRQAMHKAAEGELCKFSVSEEIGHRQSMNSTAYTTPCTNWAEDPNADMKNSKPTHVYLNNLVRCVNKQSDRTRAYRNTSD